MDTPIYTTEERVTFIKNRIKERRQFAEQTRALVEREEENQSAAWKIVRELEIKDAKAVAEAQLNVLKVLFPERFDRPNPEL